MIPSFSYPTGKESTAELADMIAKLMKQVEFLMTGNLSSKNVREIGGWLIDGDRIVSADGDVGMSTADDGIDPVRLFAGGAVKETAPWRVTQGGKMHATGATIESSDGYPKIVLDPDGNLFGAYLDEDNYFEIQPSYTPTGGSPTLYWVSGGSVASELSVSGGSSGGSYTIKAIARELNLATEVQGNINLIPVDGYSVVIPSLFGVLLANTGQTLQSSFDTKASVGADTEDYTQPNHNHGIPDGIRLATTSDGSTVSGSVVFSASGGFTHHHKQT